MSKKVAIIVPGICPSELFISTLLVQSSRLMSLCKKKNEFHLLSIKREQCNIVDIQYYKLTFL